MSFQVCLWMKARKPSCSDKTTNSALSVQLLQATRWHINLEIAVNNSTFCERKEKGGILRWPFGVTEGVLYSTALGMPEASLFQTQSTCLHELHIQGTELLHVALQKAKGCVKNGGSIRPTGRCHNWDKISIEIGAVSPWSLFPLFFQV